MDSGGRNEPFVRGSCSTPSLSCLPVVICRRELNGSLCGHMVRMKMEYFDSLSSLTLMWLGFRLCAQMLMCQE